MGKFYNFLSSAVRQRPAVDINAPQLVDAAVARSTAPENGRAVSKCGGGAAGAVQGFI